MEEKKNTEDDGNYAENIDHGPGARADDFLIQRKSDKQREGAQSRDDEKGMGRSRPPQELGEGLEDQIGNVNEGEQNLEPELVVKLLQKANHDFPLQSGLRAVSRNLFGGTAELLREARGYGGGRDAVMFFQCHIKAS
jgi:hypothetical protein